MWIHTCICLLSTYQLVNSFLHYIYLTPLPIYYAHLKTLSIARIGALYVIKVTKTPWMIVIWNDLYIHQTIVTNGILIQKAPSWQYVFILVHRSYNVMIFVFRNTSQKEFSLLELADQAKREWKEMNAREKCKVKWKVLGLAAQ